MMYVGNTELGFLGAPSPQAVQCGDLIDAMMQKRLDEESSAQTIRWVWAIGLLAGGGYFFTQTQTGKDLAKSLYGKIKK